MELPSASVEPVTISDVLDLATWNRPRSSEELTGFLDRHAIYLSDDELFA